MLAVRDSGVVAVGCELDPPPSSPWCVAGGNVAKVIDDVTTNSRLVTGNKPSS